MPLRNLTWVLTTGEAGMRSQALGLAEAVGLPVEEKRIAVSPWYGWLPGGLLPMPLAALDPSSDPLTPPWPRLVIGCGRRSIGPALMVKWLSDGRTLAAYVQNPEWGRRKFDLVAVMPHDGVTGSNVVMAPTALHAVTQKGLAEAQEAWRGRLSNDGRPVLGVLVGGDNGGYRLTAHVAAQLIRILRAACEKHGTRIVVTPSRRTPDDIKRLLGDAVASENLGSMWDGTGENPYLGILALADRLIVTAESISMISEALATGRPVHVLPLEGQGKRHDAFLTRIIAEKLVSPLRGDDLDWAFQSSGPIVSTAAPAARIKAMLERRPVVQDA
jgi:mitochondrial fission protein ELM1